MKKLTLIIIALVAVTTSMIAGNKVSTVSGNLNAINGKKVCMAYDYSKMMILDEDSKKTMTEEEFCKMKGEDWVRDMGKDSKEAEECFVDKLNDKAKAFMVETNPSTADFTITCQPTTFSYGNPFAFTAFMSNDVHGYFIGKFIITDKSGNEIAVLDCKKVCGDTGFKSWTKQKKMVYENVAEQLAKALNKAK